MVDYEPLDSEKFEKIRLMYVESFPEKIQTLQNCYANLGSSKELASVLIEFKNECHKLAGSSGSHGFDEIYKSSKKIEKQLDQVIEQESHWEEVQGHISQQFNALLTLLRNRISEYDIPQYENEQIDRSENYHLSHRGLPIYLVSERETELTLLSNMLRNRGFLIYSFTNIEQAKLKSKAIMPAIIVLDIDNAHQLIDEKDIKKVFSPVNQEPPELVVISRMDDLDIRINASWCGVDALFASPINSHNFISTLDVMLELKQLKQGRILFADDDTERVNCISNILKEQNIKCLTVNQVSHIIDALFDYKPDLILISLDLCDSEYGNVAKMIRSHEYYFNVPVICLLAQEDHNIKSKLLGSGVDDCITQDELNADNLIALKQKIIRFRRANHLIIMDSLTGTLSRDAFVDRASEEISLAKRRNENICLAMIDVDHFKKINDTYGHATGDHVLRHLSDYLNNRLRRSDVVGRYGGDEFLVLLPDTNLDSAYLVLDMVRENLITQNISTSNAEVCVSISLGLVSVRPKDAVNIETLIIEADKKLYEAKISGRNLLVSTVLQ
ncbi:MAG: diguanylate cyclase [Pseudomonadota bacterium]